MDLRDCLRAMRRHWWLIPTAIGLALGGACLATALSVPQHAASVTFFVATPSQSVTDSYQGGMFSQQRVKSYADLLTGDRLARAVASDPGVKLTSTQVRKRISSRDVPNTVLLEATVTDSDPGRSEHMAKVLARQFVALVETLETPPGQDTPVVKVEVVAGPTLDPVPVSPRPVRNFALAGLLGLLAGTSAAVLREVLDYTVKTAEAVQEVVAAPALAVVPFDPNAKQAPLVIDADTGPGSRSSSARSEAFRHLRTNLQFVDVDHPAKVIAITSSVPGEGKSTTAVNVAIAFAEAGRRVLLIEGDLRRPRVSHYMGLENAVGLSNVLAGQIGVDEAMQRWGRHELFVLPSGFVPPNPSELLGSRNMAELLDRLRGAFDVVIVDTPPLLPVTDAVVVAANADGAVLVIRSGKTHQTRIRRAVATLATVDSRLLGCVLNMQVAKAEAGYYPYYSYYQSDKSGSRDERPKRTSGKTRSTVVSKIVRHQPSEVDTGGPRDTEASPIADIQVRPQR